MPAQMIRLAYCAVLVGCAAGAPLAVAQTDAAREVNPPREVRTVTSTSPINSLVIDTPVAPTPLAQSIAATDAVDDVVSNQSGEANQSNKSNKTNNAVNSTKSSNQSRNAIQSTHSTGDARTNPRASAELTRVRELIHVGVFELARAILENRAPPQSPTEQWFEWEQQLWALYRAQGDWRTLLARCELMPADFPPRMRRAAKLNSIDALTALRRAPDARRLIREELSGDERSPLYQRQLRQALVAAYLTDGLLADARVAMAKFRRDYGEPGIESALLSAAVLINSGDNDAAINLLAPFDRPRARLLRLTARLNNQTLSGREVRARARALLQSSPGKLPPRDVYALITAAAKTGDRLGNLIDALENYLIAPPTAAAQFALYPTHSADELADAYGKFAQKQANQLGLLIGDDRAWLAHATQLPPEQKITRRAWFAHVAATADSPQLRRRAADGYVRAVIDVRRGDLIKQMFGNDAPLGALSLGADAWLRLSAHAFEKGDTQLAAVAAVQLSTESRALTESADWPLQAGRIDIFAGRRARGAAQLHNWLDQHDTLNAAQTDAVLQPVFDLQTVGEHQLALQLLHKIDARAPRGKHRREIAFWLAESYQGVGQHDRAAGLFLHSALMQADGFDHWGVAARHRAADALADAGLFADAARLYRDLLARAPDESRKSALRQKLQQLALRQSTQRTPSSR